MILTERLIWKMLEGDLDFLDSFSADYLNLLIKDVNSSIYRDTILDQSFNLIYKKNQLMAFKLTYNLPRYDQFWRRILEEDCSILYDYNALLLFLLNVPWAKDFIYEILDKLVLNNKTSVFAILMFTEKTKNFSLANYLAFHDNLDIRGLFTQELIDTHSYMLFSFYDDINECFVKYNNDNKTIELMNEEFVSRIASLVLVHNLGIDLYLKIKDFILDNYQKNTLAASLDNYGKLNMEVFTLNKEMLLRDIDKLFVTSKNYKYELATKYEKYINSCILNDFKTRIKPFDIIDSSAVSKIFLCGLGDKFLEYIDKYLEISTGSKVIRDIGMGTCSRVFRIGDYVIKLSDKKWSMEEEICPNGYLFAKNYEEDYVRKSNGEVTGAVEVQKYLTKPLVVDDYTNIGNYEKALEENGYYMKDVLADNIASANCYYLDNYRDADCDDPEQLPEWFKKFPIVLVDRDLVFRLENKKPKIKALNLNKN